MFPSGAGNRDSTWWSPGRSWCSSVAATGYGWRMWSDLADLDEMAGLALEELDIFPERLAHPSSMGVGTPGRLGVNVSPLRPLSIQTVRRAVATWVRRAAAP